ncbi:ArsR family transcriptional regulator [Natrarchaeobius sp. A-rgal3]|uniref:ArsR family transcriptional regulator n=1 Tax=Natrarchaeobius versutus TaxID=1679078 RepID=UPI00350FA486
MSIWRFSSTSTGTSYRRSNSRPAIAANIETSSGHVRRRVRTLAAADLLERTDDTAGYYRITDLGRRYLRGELTEDERETLREYDPDATGE